MVWPAVIAAGASIAGSLISKGGGSNIGRQHDVAMQDRQWAQDELFIQNRVRDAKAAGIHPLFALGASGGGGGYQVTGQSDSGSFLGEGIARAGQQIAQGMRKEKAGVRQAGQDEANLTMAAAQIRNLNSRSAINEIEALAASSALKNAEQDVWNTGAGRGDSLGVGVGGAEARTFAIGTRRGRELQRRPLTQTSRTSIPLTTEVVGRDGYRYTVINQQWDEVSQVDLVLEIGKKKAFKLWNQLKKEGSIVAGKYRRRPRTGKGKRYTRKW